MSELICKSCGKEFKGVLHHIFICNCWFIPFGIQEELADFLLKWGWVILLIITLLFVAIYYGLV